MRPLRKTIRARSLSGARWAGVLLVSALVPAMTGCLSLLTSKRRLPVPVAPASVLTVSAQDLVVGLNAKWEKFESLTATVDIQASRLKTREGVETEYPSFRGNLLLRKPEMLRILGKAPVVQTTMFDLASDGTRFTLVVPPKNKVFSGLNATKGKSPNWYENLRPGFLFSAMVVRGVDAQELYSVTAETITTEDAANKRLLMIPEYVLSVVRRTAGSQELAPDRIVRFHREDLLPYEQDLYDAKGNLETQVLYGAYQNYEGVPYPGTITLKRPQEEYQLKMSVERVTANPTLNDDQFQVKVPAGAVPQALE